ncbi:uncharacterized protein METZ01_LOCUS371977, partial [marine metagenome]
VRSPDGVLHNHVAIGAAMTHKWSPSMMSGLFDAKCLKNRFYFIA